MSAPCDLATSDGDKMWLNVASVLKKKKDATASRKRSVDKSSARRIDGKNCTEGRDGKRRKNAITFDDDDDEEEDDLAEEDSVANSSNDSESRSSFDGKDETPEPRAPSPQQPSRSHEKDKRNRGDDSAGKRNRYEETRGGHFGEDELDSTNVRSLLARSAAILTEKKRNASFDDYDAFSNNRTDLVASMDTLTMRTAWSLLARLDTQKCIVAMNVTSDQHVATVKNIVSYISWTLVRLHQLAKDHKLNLSLCSKSIEDLESSLDAETATTILREIGDNPSIEDAEKTSGSTAVQTRLLRLISNLDGYVRALVTCAAIRGGCSFAENLSNELVRFRCVNTIHDSVHENYMRDGAAFRVYAEKSQQVRTNGLFFVSLEYRTAQGNVRYPSFIDRSGHLVTIARKFVRDVILENKTLPKETGIFLNLAMRKNCADFNVLKPLATSDVELLRPHPTVTIDKTLKKCHDDPSGVLALIDLAYVKYDEAKKIIIVKGYIMCTFSSIDAQ